VLAEALLIPIPSFDEVARSSFFSSALHRVFDCLCCGLGGAKMFNEDIDEVTGNSRVEFQYHTKGAIGKKNSCLMIDLESQSLTFPDGTILPVSSIVNSSKIPNTNGTHVE
jgi:hypothetical protein